MVKWLRPHWGLLLTLALALVAAAPFLTRPGLPRSGPDAELHIYRAAELGHALRGGAFYPRWAPDLYFGYGYPIFNYYAPLAYYVANLFDLLPGVDIVGGVKGVYILGFLIASVGSYLLGRELFGPAAGVLAAASFTFAPFVVFIDPHARGGLAEHLAVCLLPLAFYAFRRLLSGVGGRGALLGSVLTLAALVFSHNLLGLVASGLLLVYWVWEVVLGPGRSRLGWGGLAFALAVGLIAFFWLPFLLERDAIKLDVVGPGYFDFHEHFLSLTELLAPSRVLDMGATAPHYRFNLGLAQWLLALPALGALAYPGATNRRTLFYFVLMGLGLIFLMLPISAAIWEGVPGMAYFQFPWRLLGPTNLMLAVCTAGGATLLSGRSGGAYERWSNRVLALALAAILLLALPLLYPPMWPPDFGDTSSLGIIQWERRSLVLGTTSTGDFLPVKAALAPVHPMPTLVESYAGPGPVDKVNRAVLPEGASVEIVEHGPCHDRFVISTPKRFVLRLYTFYFPGWRAYVDGEEVEIEVAGPEGFITLWVPRGEHEVLVRFEDTPPRVAGWIISGLALAVLVIALALMRVSHVQGDVQATGLSDPRLARVGFPPVLIWLGGILLLFVVVKSAVIDPRDEWLRYTSPPGEAWAAQHKQWISFVADGGGQIVLLGYDLPRQRVRSDETLSVVLYWHARTPLEVDYQSFVHLARPAHILWGQEDHLHPGGLPTRRWPLDKYVWDEYEIRVLPGTPPGEYMINVGIYSLGGGYRLQGYGEDGQAVGDSIGIASVKVERVWRQPRLADLDMTEEVSVSFPKGGVTLLGYSQPYSQATLPGAWPITLFWRADHDHPSAHTRALVLLDAEGQEVGRLAGAAVDGYYPFEVWRAGEIMRDPLLFVWAQPVHLKAGAYRFGVVVSTDQSLVLKPEGAEDGFVPLGTVEFLANGKAEE